MADKNNLLVVLKQHIDTLMRNSNHSIHSISIKCDVKDGTIKKIISGDDSVKVATIEKVLEGLGVRLDAKIRRVK